MFDDVEGKEVQIELNTRSVLALLLLVASTAFAVVVWFARAEIGAYAPSEDGYVMFLGILYIASLGCVWLSVALIRRIDRDMVLLALLFAIPLTLVWVYGLLFGGPQPGV